MKIRPESTEVALVQLVPMVRIPPPLAVTLLSEKMDTLTMTMTSWIGHKMCVP